MTLAEFKAWLEGFSASFKDGCPNAEQWQAINKKLATVQPLRFDYAPPDHERPDLPFPVNSPIWVAPTPRTGDPVPYWQNPVISTCIGRA